MGRWAGELGRYGEMGRKSGEIWGDGPWPKREALAQRVGLGVGSDKGGLVVAAAIKVLVQQGIVPSACVKVAVLVGGSGRADWPNNLKINI